MQCEATTFFPWDMFLLPKIFNKFSCIAAPLFELTKNGKKFIWNETAGQAFATLKEKLCSTPILALTRDDAQTILDVNASDAGVGAVLSQIQDNEEKVLAYASRVYNDAEKNNFISRR
jgi:RNase H-like domain found in reverse transcriptase